MNAKETGGGTGGGGGTRLPLSLKRPLSWTSALEMNQRVHQQGPSIPYPNSLQAPYITARVLLPAGGIDGPRARLKPCGYLCKLWRPTAVRRAQQAALGRQRSRSAYRFAPQCGRFPPQCGRFAPQCGRFSHRIVVDFDRSAVVSPAVRKSSAVEVDRTGAEQCGTPSNRAPPSYWETPSNCTGRE